AVAQRLVEAANLAGGRDNISVVFVAGPEFAGTGSHAMQEARARHGITRMRRGGSRWRGATNRLAWLLAGIVLGMLLWDAVNRVVPRQAAVAAQTDVAQTVVVDAADPRAILAALSAARRGDTIEVPAGQYIGPIVLKDGVSLISRQPHEAVIRADSSAGADSGVAFIARGVHSVRLSGFRIEGSNAAPLSTGLLLDHAVVEADDLEISGARDCGVRIGGDSAGVLRANYIHDNPGCGVWIGGGSTPRLAGNRISRNGTTAGALRFGVEIQSPAAPVLENNIIEGNGRRDFGSAAGVAADAIAHDNVTDFQTNR
ncbi:MAG: right-handed parallel beta-helix repeat-containing protein, partial [Bryobacteraceae bacterium]